MQPSEVKCRPYVKRLTRALAHSGSWTLPALCAAYQWPLKLAGGGTIAIVELGGGWSASDMAQFFKSIGQPVPTITDVSVDGTQNSHQSPRDDADYEVALDIEVAAAAYFIATGKPASIRVYWAQDIAPAINAAVKDGCHVFSCSWGASEADGGTAWVEATQAAALAGVNAGMTIFAAAGDNDADDGDNTAEVDCPACCPSVVGCGGTTKTSTLESVWNNNLGRANGEGTGGGYSHIFPVQAYQVGAPKAPLTLPGDRTPGTGRMVPDVAGCADPSTGYSIVVYGQTEIIGGTSAVAPLFAGLFAAFGAKLGFINPKLWAATNRSAFADITQGNNGDYAAIAGPDAVSGLGAPIGTKLAAIFCEHSVA